MTPFSFDANYTLENSKAVLEPMHWDHETGLGELAKDRAIWKYFLIEDQPISDFKDYLASALDQKKAQRQYPFTIIDKSTSAIAGSTRVYALDTVLGTMKIGHTWLGSSFWGSGLNRACKSLLFDFAFFEMGMHRVGFGVHGENLRSQKALERMGCVLEGKLRSFLPSLHCSQRVALLNYGMIKEDWISIRNK